MGMDQPAAGAEALDPGVLRALREIVGPEWVLNGTDARRTYECDGLTGWRAVPLAVVLPASTEEVVAVVRLCHAHRLPFVPRGAGTGLSGGALPTPDGIVIGLSRMRAILEVDLENERVRVQPGVANLAVTRAVAAAGYFYAPDPSSQSVCTVGGNVAENSGGAHCLKYGFTTHHVLGVTLVTSDGRVARLGGSVPDAPGYDLLGFVVGSEGTVGIVTEVTLRIVRQPERVQTLLGAFPSTDAAGAAVAAVIAAGIVPAAMEMMDRATIEAVESTMHAGYPDCGAALLVELDGPAPECASLFEEVRALCEASGATEVRVARDEAERARLWRGRKGAFSAMGRVSPDYYVQDGVIPRSQLPQVLTGIRALEGEFGLKVANVFHAGDGNLHPLILYDRRQPGDTERARSLAERILDLCLRAGGSLTGEHGVGRDKACQMPKLFSLSDQAVMLRARGAFDPLELCNPGKVLPTPRLCGEHPGIYRPHRLEVAGVAERL
ncbi:MAG TPA: FAD-linked oxidase C-terminal domain-containing protein [Candidatus Dormibacteraeota bacterium]|nr:FAD-linked oxidase C-terminal domain-containing protein [Candidatus Dormibacteraeota bacterium]